MDNIVHFPEGDESKGGYERMQSTYSIRDICRRFGISERYLRRWCRDGLIPLASFPDDREIRLDLRGLRHFRRVRDLRGQGLTLKQIDSELRGQLNLFPPEQGRVLQLPVKVSAFAEALMLHEKNDPRARERYEAAIVEGEAVADAYCNLAILEYESGNRTGALDALTQALRRDPRHFESHFNLANIYFEAGDLRLTKLHYEIALQVEPDYYPLLFNLGLVYAIDGDLRSAIRALTTAREKASEEDKRRADELLASLESILACVAPKEL